MVYFWIIAVVVFIIFELSTNALVSIWFAIGALAGMVAAIFGASEFIQVFVFLIASVLCLIPLRKAVKEKVQNNITKTNVDSIAGEKAIVTEVFDKHSHLGRVLINGMDWLGYYEGVSEINEELIVESVKGSKVILKKGE